MSRIAVGVIAVTLALSCARAVPTPTPASDLPAFSARKSTEQLDVVLGAKGRYAMIGEFKLSPEAMGVDLSAITRSTNMVNGAVWCVEPEDWVADTLIMRVGLTWWPPGSEPNDSTRSITEALMRCLGYLPAKPWARGTVYLRAASLPKVDVDGRKSAVRDGTETLSAALEHAFAFGLAAPFMARGLAFGGGTQDGALFDEDRGVRRRGEAHVRNDDGGWASSLRLIYSPADNAQRYNIIPGTTVNTVVKGVSYVLGRGELGMLVPSNISRAALRIEAGLARGMITMTSQLKAKYSPGLSCVLRTLSSPRAATTGEGAKPAYPGVDLEAAQKCELSDEDQEGPPRTIF